MSATMLRLTERRRVLLAEKVADIANLITAAVVVGFVIGEGDATGVRVVTALALWGAALGFSAWMTEDEQ